MSLRLCRLLPCLCALALSAGPAAAQAPSPLELVRGLRDNGQTDLALEYLKEIEGKPLSPDDKAAISLERAKCLLEASEGEADEGTRQGMIAEAREMLNAFVTAHPKHPRAVEGLLTDAKLVSLDANEQLGRARKVEVPPASPDPEEGRAREAAQKQKYEQAADTRKLFQLAAGRFAAASKLLREKLEDKTLEPAVRRILEREAFEAELAAGVNQFSLADTFVPPEILTLDQKKQRDTFLEQAKATFGKLATGPDTSRAKWVARAWIAEITYEQDKRKEAADEVAAVLRATAVEAEDGKRTARFFQLRRNFFEAAKTLKAGDLEASDKEMQGWLERYAAGKKPTPEVYAVRYYRARLLHVRADLATAPAAPGGPPKALDTESRRRLVDAEKLYRGLTQTDNEFTTRATRHRMAAVRKLLGNADANPLAYAKFEDAQMASLIQLGNLVAAEAKADKLAAAEKPDEAQVAAARAEVRATRGRVIALLERARGLAGPTDNVGDVTDVLLRLIYFYEQNGQSYQAAVLGEFVAHTVKTTGGKAAVAGLLGVYGYLSAGEQAKGELEFVREARQADRGRAAALARFLDEKYPNDTATDSARLILADLLKDDKEYAKAYDMLLRIRPGFTRLTKARLLLVFVVRPLVVPLDAALPPAKRAELFRRTASELAKVPKPPAVADRDDARDYLRARYQLALLMLAQDRADADTERTNAGFNQALNLATELLAEVPTFDSMVTDPKAAEKKLSLDGREMHALALDVYTRALYLRARRMIDNAQLDGALALVQPVLDEVQKGGALYTDEMKGWAGNAGGGEPDAKQKAEIGKLAETIDRMRVNVILSAFRVRVEQAKAAEAAALLDLMLKAGGSFEASLPMLEPVGRELAARYTKLRKEGKADEAKNLSAGLTVLLDKIRTVPKLPPASVLFIGNTLQAVGENEKALEELKKVPAPGVAGWEALTPDKYPADRPELPSQINRYAAAQIATARALRGLKRYPEAEGLLRGIVGTPGKPGWGSGKLPLRKELAELYEAKGADAPTPKAANTEWAQAVNEWSTIFNMRKAQFNTAVNPPKGATAPTPQALADLRNDYADAFFDVQRATVAANQQVWKGTPTADQKLQTLYENVSKQFVVMEKQVPAGEWHPDVQNRYADMLHANPPLLAAYKAAGGKAFLEKLPPRAAP